MNTTGIIEILRANHVKVHAKFERVCRSEGCVTGMRDLYEEALAEISALLLQGVNCSGMTPAIRKSINKLSAMVVTISQKTTVAEHAKLQKKLGKLVGTVKIEEGVLQMKNEVLKWIEGYRSGIEVVMQGKSVGDRVQHLEACKARLDALETALGNIVDVTSKDALAHAQKIVNGLRQWSESLAVGTYGSMTAGQLDSVIREAKQWAAIREARTGLFGSRKPVDISSIRFDVEAKDRAALIRIGQSKMHLENINNFQIVLEAHKESIRGFYGVEDEEAKLATHTARKAKLLDNISALQADFQNGRISGADFQDDLLDIQDEIVAIDESVEDLKERVRSKKAAYSAQQKVLDIIDDILDMIERYKDTDVETLAELGEIIDFNSLSRMIRGKSTEADEELLVTLESIREGILMDAMEKGLELSSRMRALADQRRIERGAIREAHRAKNPARAREQMSAQELIEMAQRMRGGVTAPQQPTGGTQTPRTEQTEGETVIPTNGGIVNPTGFNP